MPNLRSPSSASPESFSRTRWYLVFVGPGIRGSLGCLAVRPAQLEPSEAAHAHVLPRRRGERRHQLADRLRRVADVRLGEQLVDVLRIHRRDLHRDLASELAEVVVARDEVGLARELHERADAAAAVDVGLDDALLGLATRLLLGPHEPTLLDQGLRAVEVAFRLFERALAIHHARARLLAQALYLILRVRHHSPSFFSVATSTSSVASSYRCLPSGNSSSSSGSYTRGVRFARGTPRPPSYCSGVVDGAYPMSSGDASLRDASNCWRPSRIASAIFWQISFTARIASSFAGMITSIRSGSQFVSTMAAIGISRRRASSTAMCSRCGSTTKIAVGGRRSSRTPEK